MATGTIFILQGHCNPAYTTFTIDSFTKDKQFNHADSVVAPVVAFMQPVPDPIVYGRDGVTPMSFTVNNAASVDGLINHITENFVIETRYPAGTVPADGSYTMASLKSDAISQINTAFGLSLA